MNTKEFNTVTELEIRPDLPELTKRYSHEDLIRLGSITDEVLETTVDKEYTILMRDDVLPDCEGAPIKSIMQFLGNYLLSISELDALQTMGDFIFDKPLDDMPLYINMHDDVYPWKTVVAHWRLAIGK